MVFGWFWSRGALDTQLARQNLGKKTHPNHCGRYCPMAAMVPSSWNRRIQQLANMLRDKSVVKNREYCCFYYVFISYLKTQRIVNAPCLIVCGLRGSESIILSAGGTETIICSQRALQNMIVSVLPAASMILSEPFDRVITLLCTIMLTAAWRGAIKKQQSVILMITD